MKLRRRVKKKKEKEELFGNLPSEIIIDILSRLPIPSIINCKFVRKSWLALIETPEFVNSHLLKPKPGECLVLYDFKRNLHTIHGFGDGFDIENNKLRRPRRPLFKFGLPCIYEQASASVNGLLLQYLWDHPLTLIISNPLTREYFEPPKLLCTCPPKLAALGFGATKTKVKVVTIFQNKIPKSECNCYVYTIGTGAWKKITPPAGYLNLNHHRGTVGYLLNAGILGVFMNANLHWLVTDLEASQAWISCLDLENEVFTTFSLPLPLIAATRDTRDSRKHTVVICDLGDTLCLCDDRGNITNFWLMKEYKVEKSWTKQFVIFNESPWDTIWPIKLFKDGHILMAWDGTRRLFYLSKMNRTEHSISHKFESRANAKPFLYTPNFLSLKRFERENVISF